MAAHSHAGTSHTGASQAGKAHAAKAHGTRSHAGTSHYWNLMIMTVLSFAAMYALMYAMVDRTSNVFGNLNQLYMAGLMTAAMVLIELGVMRGMYDNSRRNAIIAGGSVVALVAFWMFTRSQAGISDRQFLRSMIPHHASAILMCKEAPIADAEIKRLCRNIIAGQQTEIDQMKAKLRDLAR